MFVRSVKSGVTLLLFTVQNPIEMKRGFVTETLEGNETSVKVQE